MDSKGMIINQDEFLSIFLNLKKIFVFLIYQLTILLI
ncbi:hypothetical protein Y888_15475 [Mixta calida B021323]|nr:hypothetical protein Y888_15475 [Mixta calida B021323]